MGRVSASCHEVYLVPLCTKQLCGVPSLMLGGATIQGHSPGTGNRSSALADLAAWQVTTLHQAWTAPNMKLTKMHACGLISTRDKQCLWRFCVTLLMCVGSWNSLWDLQGS